MLHECWMVKNLLKLPCNAIRICYCFGNYYLSYMPLELDDAFRNSMSHTTNHLYNSCSNIGVELFGHTFIHNSYLVSVEDSSLNESCY